MIEYQPDMCVAYVDRVAGDPGRYELTMYVEGQEEWGPYNVSEQYLDYIFSEPHPVPICPPPGW